MTQREVVEVLELAGLTYVLVEGGVVYGVARRTSCINFDSLRVGQRIRFRVAGGHLVLRATIV